MSTYRGIGVMLALAAFALSPMEAGAAGKRERGPNTPPGALPFIAGGTDVQDITGCQFQPDPATGGMRVVACSSTGLFAGVGIEPGDIILTINNTVTNSIQALINAVTNAHATPAADNIFLKNVNGGAIVLVTVFL